MSNKYIPEEGDRVKISFEATVDYSDHAGINYIKFDNGQDLEFPTELLPDSVRVEKIEKPLEAGYWYMTENKATGVRSVMLWDGSSFNIGVDIEDGPLGSYPAKYYNVITRLEPVK